MAQFLFNAVSFFDMFLITSTKHLKVSSQIKNLNWQKQDLQNTSPGRLLDLHSKVWQLTLLTVMFISILSKFLLGLTRTLPTSHAGGVTPKGSHHQSKLGILLIRA